MSDITVTGLHWYPDRTEPTIAPATFTVEYSNGSQEFLVAEDDVSSKLPLVQNAFNSLF